jgi:hypothetical protein
LYPSFDVYGFIFVTINLFYILEDGLEGLFCKIFEEVAFLFNTRRHRLILKYAVFYSDVRRGETLKG